MKTTIIYTTVINEDGTLIKNEYFNKEKAIKENMNKKVYFLIGGIEYKLNKNNKMVISYDS